MKNEIFAIYKDKGKEYSSGKSKDGRIILRSANKEDLKMDFVECEPFKYKNNQELIVCYKYVNELDIEKYYRVRTIAIYQNYEFEVVEETEDMISIVTMVGDYQEWIRLGMKSIDNGVYQKWVTKDESEIKIVKENL